MKDDVIWFGFLHLTHHASDIFAEVIGIGVFALIILYRIFTWRWFVYFWLNRKNPKADRIMTEDELRAAGYTEKQIRSELRAQRRDQRSHDWLRNSNIRTSKSFWRK